LLIQTRGFSFALDHRDLLEMATAGTQAFVLMLQMLRISYLLYALGGRPLGATLKRISLRRAKV
jgi:hypothetical protein